MSNLDKMWEALEKYQPYADKYGFGEAWRRMTTERTAEAAYGAADAAEAAYGAADAADAANEAGWAASEAERAINYITRAIERENENEC